MKAVLALALFALLGNSMAARIQADKQELVPVDKHHHDKAKLCSDLRDQDDCLDGFKDAACAWCEGDTMEVCVDAEAAYGISPRVAKCKGALPPRKPICSDLLTKSDCMDYAATSNKKHKGSPSCAWCEGDNMASCVDAQAASFMPEGAAKCRGAALPKDKKCDDLKEESICLRGTADGACAWCEGGFMPAKCLDEQAAKFIPDMVSHCKMGSKAGDDTNDRTSSGSPSA